MSEKRFELTKINPTINPFDTVYFIIDYENPSKNIINLKDCVECLNEQQSIINRQSEQHKQILNELINENSELRMKIVSLENEIQRQNNELKNTRKEFTKKTDELNWLKSEDYLKKIY